MRGNAFSRIEEFSCENLTLSASSFSFSSLSLLCCQSQLFFKEGGCEQEKPHKQTAERWKMLFLKGFFASIPLQFSFLHLYREGSPVWSALGSAYPWCVHRCHHLWWGRPQLKTCPWKKGKTKARINRKDNKKDERIVEKQKSKSLSCDASGGIIRKLL